MIINPFLTSPALAVLNITLLTTTRTTRVVVSKLTWFFFAIFFFVLNINYNLCDDVCEEKKWILRPNEEIWSMQKFEIFFCKSCFFLFLVLKNGKLMQFHYWHRICCGHFRSCSPISNESRGIGLFLICNALVGSELFIDSVSNWSTPFLMDNGQKNKKNKKKIKKNVFFWKKMKKIRQYQVKFVFCYSCAL
jgi:hypothetical protein